MQKLSAVGKFRFQPPFTSLDHLVGNGEHARRSRASNPDERSRYAIANRPRARGFLSADISAAIRGTGRYGTSRGIAYIGLMLAATITLPHFLISSEMSLPQSAGEPPSTVPPRLASRALNFGSAMLILTSLFSLSMRSAGVPFGAPMPYHALAS